MTEPPNPPRWPGVARRALEAAVILALLLTVVFARFHEPTRFMATLQKLAHPVTFGAVALLAFDLLRHVGRLAARPPRVTFLAAFAVAVLGGAATEVAQGFVHRDPAVFDVLRDAWGAATALLAWAALGRGRGAGPDLYPPGRWAAAAVAVVGLGVMGFPLALCLAAYAHRDLEYPTLAAACSPFDRYFLRGVAAQLSDVAAVPPAGTPCGRALRVDLRPAMYPGLHLVEPYPDWSRARTLVLALRNPGAADLPLGLRVHDRQHNQEYRDRFNREFVLPAGAHLEVAIPLREIERAPLGRRLDLKKVADLTLYRVRGADAASFEVETIALRP